MNTTIGQTPKLDSSVLSIGFSNEDLCARCGTCTGASPTGAITVNDRMFPSLLPD